MHSDDDLQTTLSKWPFILGDVLLVATALAIAILGQWQLTNWQVAACVVSVALGAALFVLPYVVEFQVRVREEAEDRGAEQRMLQRQLVNTQDQLEAVSDRIEAIEGGLVNLVQAKPDPTAPFEALEQRIEPLYRSKDAHSGELAALAEQTGALVEKVESLENNLKSKPEAEASAEGELKAKKNREPRKRRHSEPGLLNRAIEQKRDHSSAAVSRIIATKNKKKAEAETMPAGEEPAATSLVEAEPEPPIEAPFVGPEAETTPEITGSQKAEPDTEMVDAAENSEPEPEAEESHPAESEREPQPESPVAETEDMFAEAVPPQVAKRARTKKSDTAVIASVFIGIGNKPFVRGSGAGLNWENGVAMEFEAIGRWRWLAADDLDKPVELQLFRNDEDPDKTGKYILEPGQQLELSPVF